MKAPSSVVLVAVGVIAGATVATGVIIAVSAGAGNTTAAYYGCVSARGALSKVGTTAPTCPGKNAPISWNSYPSNANGTPQCTGIPHEGIDLSGCDLAGADLVNTDLTGAILDGANLSGSILNGYNQTAANFTNANLQGVNFSNANLGYQGGVNFDGANLTGAIFAGVPTLAIEYSTWVGAICPDGTNESADGGSSCYGHMTPA